MSTCVVSPSASAGRVQLIGRAYREDVCLDAAEVVERVVTPRTPAGS
ncbi:MULTISPECIES: hypothetical protein [Saccharothrix]|nr:hypothetical protein [Saccharothrix sp. CB00851]